MKNKIDKILNFIKRYIKRNKVFFLFLVINLIMTFTLRLCTTKKVFTLNPIFGDIGIITIFASLSFLFKNPKKRKIYLYIQLFFNTFICLANAIYYSFYASFASLSEISGLSQTGKVAGSLFEKLSFIHFIYLLGPICFIYFNHKWKNEEKPTYTKTISNRKFKKHLLAGFIILLLTFVTAQGSDYSRLYKQWNRPYAVNRFGITLYQTVDIFNYITSNITQTFGYQDALLETEEYYKQDKQYEENNKYTDIFDGSNIIFVHMESIQSDLLDYQFNGEDVLPTTKKLINEGMYFSNFYPQVSLGTSSDTEFTLLTSLLPTNTGIVFTNYYNRRYVTLAKLLNDKNYYTFSMHGNDFNMWNRDKAHPLLGYNNYYFKDKYEVTEENSYNLGISDEAFFEQSINYLEQIEKENTNYMGTVITLSNHSPYTFLDKYAPFDLSEKYNIVNEETGLIEETTIDYLTGTTIGNYIISSHSADLALGKFVDSINNSNYFNNTIFVFYGDHDAKLSSSQYNYLYNYDPITKELLEEDDINYQAYDEVSELYSKKTPLIIWSKNKDIQNILHQEVTYPMGMIDILPTIGNMININNYYSLGHDIFNIKNDNIVIFPNGSYVTNDYYYNNSSDKIYSLKSNIVIDDNIIEKNQQYSDEIISISNNVIKFDLINAIETKKEIERKDK